MMEHEIPKSPMIRALFYVRLFSMGLSRGVQIMKHEERLLVNHFQEVRRVRAPHGKSKRMVSRDGSQKRG